MTRQISSIADAQELVGQVLGPSDGVLVEQERIDIFAEATGDHQWIHTDPSRAATGPFGATIAHGYLTLSLLPVLAAGIYTLGFGSARLNYGSNRVRFPSPVKVGATLRATAQLIDVRTEPQGTFITTRITITADGADKPACIAETITLVVYEPSGEESS